MARPRRTAAPTPVEPAPVPYAALHEEPAPAPTDDLLVFLDYDTWINDERIRADRLTPVRLPRERAKALLAEGKARRADPLPGE